MVCDMETTNEQPALVCESCDGLGVVFYDHPTLGYGDPETEAAGDTCDTCSGLGHLTCRSCDAPAAVAGHRPLCALCAVFECSAARALAAGVTMPAVRRAAGMVA